MTNKILIITPPDTISEDGIRILLVDLTPSQTQIVSDSLSTFNWFPNTIVYMWKDGDDIQWLFNNKPACNLIIFNAESINYLLVGYCAAQLNSYYFGTLRTLSSVNKSEIYTTEQCTSIVESILTQGHTV